MKWEYKTLTYIIPYGSGFDIVEPALNKLGKEGWELVSFSYTIPINAIFKRKIQP